jgi:hypothetical protein
MAKIRNKAEFEAWLNDKPREWAQALSARIALRVLPFIYSPKIRFDLTKAVCRALFISACARSYPHAEMTQAAADAAADAAAYAAADAAADAAAYAAAYAAADAAAYAADAAAAAYAADAAAYAAYAADIWESIESDAIWLEGQTSDEAIKLAQALMNRPLWPSDMPEIISENWGRLKSQLLGANQDWDIWVDWYENRLTGGPIAFSLLPIPYDEITLEIATETNEFWERDPAIINADIKARLLAAVEEPDLIDPTAQAFGVNAAKKIDYAEIVDVDKIPDDQGSFDRYDALKHSVKRLQALGRNHYYEDLAQEINELFDILSERVTDLRVHAFWPRFKRLPLAMERHKLAGPVEMRNQDYAEYRLGEIAFQELKDMLENGYEFINSVPALKAKELQSSSPADKLKTLSSLSDVQAFILEMSGNKNITELRVNIDMKVHAEAIELYIKYGENGNTAAEAVKANENFIGILLKETAKGGFSETGKIIASSLWRHKDAIMQFIATKGPEVVQKAAELFNIIGGFIL